MTAAVLRNTPSMSVPLTQNTAPVLEFTCLYTHDARKKQKKWQDGFLRYHTFNKRVMVYDVPRNFIGDMHWAGEDAVQDGDELTLDRGGVVVEVGESVGQTETDLTELRKSKNRPTSTLPQAQTPARNTHTAIMQPASRNVARTNTQLKHKSLNALLGPSKGLIGKAQLPTRSPFEERHGNDENEDWEDGRPSKRPRVERVARTVERPRPVKLSEAPLRPRTTNPVNQKKKSAGLSDDHGSKEAGGILDDASQQNDFLPGFSDDVLGWSSSPPRQQSVATNGVLGRSSSPAFQVQQAGPVSGRVVSRNEVLAKASSAKQAAGKPPRMSANALSKPSGDYASRVAQHAAKASPTRRSDHDAQRPASSRNGQTLRLSSTGPKRRTLLCQDQLLNRQRLGSARPDGAAPLLHGRDAPRPDIRPLTTSEKLQARLARIEAKKQTSRSPPASGPSRAKPGEMQHRAPAVIEIDSDENLPDGPPMDIDQEDETPRPRTSVETGGVRLARLDKRMLPPAAPRPPKPAARPFPTSPKSRTTQPSPLRGDRSLRRVLSESTVIPPTKSKRAPGQPVRYTPSPTRTSRGSTPASGNGSRQVTPAPTLAQDKTKTSRHPRSPPDRTAYKKKGPLQKSVSLNLTSNGTSTVILSKPFQAPGQAAAAASKRQKREPSIDLGPWSREAFDLFTWRPPGWDDEKWCLDPSAVQGTTGTTSATSTSPALPPRPGLSGGAECPTFGRPQV